MAKGGYNPCCDTSDWAEAWAGVRRCPRHGTLLHVASGRTVECGDFRSATRAQQPRPEPVKIIPPPAPPPPPPPTPVIAQKPRARVAAAVEIVTAGEPYTSESVQRLCHACVLDDCDQGAALCLVSIARRRDKRLAPHGSTRKAERKQPQPARADKEDVGRVKMTTRPWTACDLSNVRCPACGRKGARAWKAFDRHPVAQCKACRHRWSLNLESAAATTAARGQQHFG